MSSNALRLAEAVPDAGWRSALFSESPVALAVVSLDGLLVSVNGAFVSLLGVPRSEVAGQAWSNFADPRHAEVIRAELAQLSYTENEHFTCEVRFLTKNDSVVTVLHGRGLYSGSTLSGYVFYAVPLVCPLPATTVHADSRSHDAGEQMGRPRTWKEALAQKPTEVLLTVLVIAVLVGKEGVERIINAIIQMFDK